MKHKQLQVLLMFCVFAVANAPATERYVDVNSVSPTSPYTSWATAATNIQHAVDVAVAGDEIVVTNGLYATGASAHSQWLDRVYVGKPLSLRSVNGPQFTVIRGDFYTRCVELESGASLSGFTLTNGFAFKEYSLGVGGGVLCNNTNAVVSNCLLVGNAAHTGGGTYGGTLINCTLANNSAQNGGGGAGGNGFRGCRLINCTLTGNQASVSGGGAYGGTCVLIDCTLTNNSADLFGGAAEHCTLFGCTLTGNFGDSGARNCTLNNCALTIHYGDSAARNCTLNNCTLTGNYASTGARDSTLKNCTLTGNWTGAAGCTLNNCIVYYNHGGAEHSNSILNFCCTSYPPDGGGGNITNAPLFSGNLRLQSNSTCINAGKNSYAPAGFDLDGNPRIAGGTVDIGAYEFQSPSSVLSYAWAQQYGLPTDGSADYSDSDSDLLNNWQEWIAGTVPTDAVSALRLLDPNPNLSGAIVTWQSVSNRTYFLERATNLGAQPPFSLVTSNIIGQSATTSYTDTNATGPGPFFYRVGVQ